MVLADPPYSSGGRTITEKRRDPRRKYIADGDPGRASFDGDNRDARSWTFWSTLWLTQACRVLKPGGYLLTFTDWRQLPSTTDAIQAGGILWRGVVAWDKGPQARAPHPGYFRHQAEYVVWGTKGRAPTTSGGRGPFPGVFSVPIDRNDKHHVVGKPTALLRQLVQVVEPGAVVLDPFAGSGTTVVACALEGRRGVGFEAVAVHVETAARRLAGLGLGKAAQSAP